MTGHAEVWTLKELFTYPNEYIYWSVQIVMYPFLTGLVAGAFVLSSLYHLFGVKELKDMARFALVLSFALLLAAPIPLQLHLLQPFRGVNVLFTPHFTSAIAAFGIVFLTYAFIVASEIWFVYRRHIVDSAVRLKEMAYRSGWEKVQGLVFRALTLGSYDVSETALRRDEKAIRILAGVGIPVAAFLHGYAGFIFGSVKANALWMTPLMPVIFIMSAIVSGIALCLLAYIIIQAVHRRRRRAYGRRPAGTADPLATDRNVISMTLTYLIVFMIFAISLELLDLVFRGYTAVKHWDILKTIIYGRDFRNVFILQYLLGTLVPLLLFLIPRPSPGRVVAGLVLVLFGVFMMRWNVVIGGQAFSLTFAGYMDYLLPIIPRDWSTFKEGLGGVLLVLAAPFLFFTLLVKVFPVFEQQRSS